MTTIKVKPGQLLAISKQFEEAHYQVSQMTNRLKQRIVEIEQMWDGSTKENFYANFIYAQQAMDKFLDGSITISKELERHAEKFKNADNQSLETYGSPESNDAKAPAADTRNAFQKSADSIVELGQAFLQSADDRYQKRYDSVGGFLDYWTFGIPSGLVSGYVDRAEKAFNSPNDAANWITFGIHGTIREATFPTNAWSSEHWANIFGVGGLMLGGGYASSMMKPHNLFTGGGPKINPSTRPGTGNMTGGFNGFQDQRMRVTENIAESKKARESSKFSEFVEKEKEMDKRRSLKNEISEQVSVSEKLQRPYDHLVNVEGIKRGGRPGVSGGHNKDNFYNSLQEDASKYGLSVEKDYIVGEPKKHSIEGIYEVEYQIPSIQRTEKDKSIFEALKDSEGNVLGKRVNDPKTVYDPNMISDEKMYNWGKAALEQQIQAGNVKNGIVKGELDGLKFVGFVDDERKIRNFYPIFEYKD